MYLATIIQHVYGHKHLFYITFFFNCLFTMNPEEH